MDEHWATIKCSGAVFSAKTELLESFDQVSQARREGRKPVESFLPVLWTCSCNYELFLALWPKCLCQARGNDAIDIVG